MDLIMLYYFIQVLIIKGSYPMKIDYFYKQK
jgi:hypothetical protein